MINNQFSFFIFSNFFPINQPTSFFVVGLVVVSLVVVGFTVDVVTFAVVVSFAVDVVCEAVD